MRAFLSSVPMVCNWNPVWLNSIFFSGRCCSLSLQTVICKLKPVPFSFDVVKSFFFSLASLICVRVCVCVCSTSAWYWPSCVNVLVDLQPSIRYYALFAPRIMGVSSTRRRETRKAIIYFCFCYCCRSIDVYVYIFMWHKDSSVILAMPTATLDARTHRHMRPYLGQMCV